MHKFVYKAVHLNLILNYLFSLSWNSNVPRDSSAVLVNGALETETFSLKRLSKIINLDIICRRDLQYLSY